MDRKWYIRCGEIKSIALAPDPTTAAVKVLCSVFERHVKLDELVEQCESCEEFCEKAHDATMEQYARLGLFTFASERGWSYADDSLQTPTGLLLARVVQIQRRRQGF